MTILEKSAIFENTLAFKGLSDGKHVFSFLMVNTTLHGALILRNDCGKCILLLYCVLDSEFGKN